MLFRLVAVSCALLCFSSLLNAEHNYQILDVSLPFSQAYMICREAASSRLATINSEEEKTTLANLLQENEIESAWVGLVGLPGNLVMLLDGRNPISSSKVATRYGVGHLCGVLTTQGFQSLIACNSTRAVICENDPTDCAPANEKSIKFH